MPDENYAREVMQLFSIGLHQLNADGTRCIDADGKPIETYSPTTSPAWPRCSPAGAGTRPGTTDRQRASAATPQLHAMTPMRDMKPMIGYPKYHSTGEKRFLGSHDRGAGHGRSARPSLKVALDTLFNHPNVGPFIGKQLIQRLVTSNPSPAYVGRVAAAFANNGAGVRGDMTAVVRAILLDPEARDADAGDSRSGKLREPMLRLTALHARVQRHARRGRFRIGATDDPAQTARQTPMRLAVGVQLLPPGLHAAEHADRRRRAWSRPRCRSSTRPRSPAT